MYSLQGKAAGRPAGNWFQLLMVLFAKEYLTTSYDRDIIIKQMSSINVFANLPADFRGTAHVCNMVS